MKNVSILVSFLLLNNYLQASEKFLQNKLDAANTVMVDIVEEVRDNYVPCSFENVEQIKSQVHELMQTAQQKKDERSRLYSAIVISHLFKISNGDNYLHYSLFCVEIDPFILNSMSLDESEQLEQAIVQKVIKMYSDQRVAVERVVPSCFVSCVQLGVEKLEQ